VSEYPEHEKLQAVKAEADAAAEFLDHLLDAGYVIARHKCPHGAEPMEECETSKYCRRGEEALALWSEQTGDRWKSERLAEHFGIDLRKIEAEKVAMLAAMRATA
jgi:hypothetical protein